MRVEVAADNHGQRAVGVRIQRVEQCLHLPRTAGAVGAVLQMHGTGDEAADVGSDRHPVADAALSVRRRIPVRLLVEAYDDRNLRRQRRNNAVAVVAFRVGMAPVRVGDSPGCSSI
jgi:hypothetical protein